MSTVVLFIVIVVAAYAAIRFNTKAGTEAVRAYIFLKHQAIAHADEELETINSVVDYSMRDPSTASKAIQEATFTYRNVLGKQLPVIGEAYRRGMRPDMPSWYTAKALTAPVPSSVIEFYRRAGE